MDPIQHLGHAGDESTRHYEQVLRRAELFDHIVALVKTWPGSGRVGPAPAEDQRPRPVSPLPLADLARPRRDAAAADVRSLKDLLPRVAVLDYRVVCNGATLDLARRPLTLRLFQVFCDAPGLTLPRDEVVRQVYKLGPIGERSARLQESAFNNSVKLISRARILAARSLSQGVGHGVEWFVYDQEQRVWSLYRLRHAYIAERLG
jgi:hypothetical protein